MKVKIVLTGRDNVGAEEMIQKAITEIAVGGGDIIAFSDSGMRVGIYYKEGAKAEKHCEPKKEKKTNAKQNSADNNGRTKRTKVAGRSTRTSKPSSNRKNDKI